MAKVQESLNRVALSGGEVSALVKWPDEMTEDYLSLHDDIDSLGDAVDQIAGENGAPALATSTGKAGQIAFDSSYLYVCIATDTWKRTALIAF